MTLTDTLSAGGAKLRITPWRGRSDVAEIMALPPGASVATTLVQTAVERCAAAGYARIVTPALPYFECRSYFNAGFAVQERLHLLQRSLTDLPPKSSIRLRRATPQDRPRVLEVDNAAFQPFWKLDDEALDSAIKATPSARFRVNRDDGVVGYAICGRSTGRGYVQRLGVDPDAEGNGIGSALLIDGLYWLRRWRCHEVMVNTQESNQRVVGLYEQYGFRRRRDGLSVLNLDIESAR